jgi:subtilisin
MWGGKIKYTYHLIPVIAASVPSAALNGLRNNPNIIYVDEDRDFYVSGELSESWGVDRIDADLAWPISRGFGVLVTVLDTGIDWDHPDLISSIAGGVNFVKTGRNADPGAWDDDNGHGTHCAGIIAADDNESGVVGVAPDALLYGVKVFDKRGRGKESDIIAGIEWSVVGPDGFADTGDEAKVISMSFGAYVWPGTLNWACEAAYEAGIVLVAAAGNEYRDKVDSPADYPSVIAVSATDKNDGIAPYSRTGSAVELAAPGTDIYSSYNDGTSTYMTGTSMSCPHVSGVAALVWATGLYQNGTAVRYQLGNTAENIGLSPEEQGYGLVDAEQAVKPPALALNVVKLNIDQIRYQQGTDVPAILTAVINDEYGSAVSGLNTSFLKSTIASDPGYNHVPVDVTWTNPKPGIYLGAVDISGLAAGQYEIKTEVLTDTGITGKSGLVPFLVEESSGGYLVVGITTPKDVYTYGETMVFTVHVTDENGQDIDSAGVYYELEKPDWKNPWGNEYTDENGLFVFEWRIKKNAVAGTYRFYACAHKDGYISGDSYKVVEVR